MDNNASQEPVGDMPASSSGESAERALLPGEPGEGGPPGEPQVTFRANTYDLLSLGSLITGALILFSCLTCNLGYYCLPLVSVVLGAVGVLSARQAVEEKRTRLWSWLGIATGGIVLLFVVAAIVLYVGFLFLAIVANKWD
jgi:hypothetical protein